MSLEVLGTLVLKNLNGKEQSMLRFDRSVPTYLAKVPTQDGKSDDPADDQTSTINLEHPETPQCKHHPGTHLIIATGGVQAYSTCRCDACLSRRACTVLMPVLPRDIWATGALDTTYKSSYTREAI